MNIELHYYISFRKLGTNLLLMHFLKKSSSKNSGKFEISQIACEICHCIGGPGEFCKVSVGPAAAANNVWAAFTFEGNKTKT